MKTAALKISALLLMAGLTAHAEDKVGAMGASTDLNMVLTEARCVPEFENGKQTGYRCFQIMPGSIYDKLGLKDNDVVREVNGVPATDASAVIHEFTKARGPGTREITVKLVRDGKEITRTFDAAAAKEKAHARARTLAKKKPSTQGKK